MALKGSLADISLPDLIQLNCQSAARVRVVVSRGAETITLYFDGGEIVHAVSGADQGESAVYQALAWSEGAFEAEQGIAPDPTGPRTVTTPWTVLVMEGLRRADETRLGQQAIPAPNRLQTALNTLAERSSFQGLAVVGQDGVVLAVEFQGQSPDASRIGAVSAGLVNLSVRSLKQLACGSLRQTMIQGSSGNVILCQAGPEAVLVALAESHINLGMAFLEAREGAQTIAEVLGS